MNIHSVVAAASTSETSEKRDAIFAAALELFAERGFHGVAVPEIAQKAKVGAGTIYRYFPSKEALINALFQHHKQELGAHFLSGLDLNGPPRAVFKQFWARACDLARTKPKVIEFLELHHHAPYLDEKSRAIEEQLLGTAAMFIAHATAQQVFKEVQPAVLMAVVWGSFRALVQGGCDRRLTLDKTTCAQAEQCIWEAIRR
jgi:TetR/AcrR family transcriptional regulator, repressor of fatR-cypB operon